jgi:hypothetical protein
MAKIRRNKPCACGSGKKYKKCCGAPVRFIMPDGEAGLTRPDAAPVEATFNEFVVDFGGTLVGGLIPNAKEHPKNADYFFRDDDVIAELKSFEKDLFNVPEDVERIFKIIAKHRDSGAVSGYRGFRWAIGQDPIPVEYRRDMLSLARRSIEHAVRQANKQIRSTKQLLNKPDAKGIVLLANDGNHFSHPAEAVMLICQVMEAHFLDSDIDGFVYFTANTPAKVPDNARELNYWVPVYRLEHDPLSNFVNRLGEGWGEFYAKTIGQQVPRFQTDDVRVILPMRLNRFP